MRIEGPERPLAPASKSPAKRAGSVFSVAEPPGEPGAAAASSSESAAPIGVIGTLPAPDEPGDSADRDAARRGAALLDAVTGLQQALIGGDPLAARDRLAALARQNLGAADPGLHLVLQAVAQRAAVELARSECDL
jgi:hypothetical protein